ncbi:RES family NAD+ phosphorylase (plasmid) [Shewanella xiamenensis]|uniref:RES family NAD+ phosphorylase n=2 Tax=Shewanella xiamenensis TaxID=332186 RepID=A0ABT6UDF2_9GAMM|nr:RES family NAD+ phosphorylase [Shewanella xiamenensis]MDI5832493.1 RES family NAD+ phosphorylase [Shewanella xiamenensis]WHF57888.1 RES family NAD+ phosphorylase [Shewanella xiamenensis]
MVTEQNLSAIALDNVTAYRLVNSKFPPIALFDEVANAEDFEIIYELQALTNPRLAAQAGNLALIEKEEIPFGIRGCSYATAAFTHVNQNGGRFNTPNFGVFYAASNVQTALDEVKYHQQKYFQGVPEMKYERLVFRVLQCQFSSVKCSDITGYGFDHAYYHPTDYSESQAYAMMLKLKGFDGVQYDSVRNQGGICWGLFTPRIISDVIQTQHYEMVYNGKFISSVSPIG